MDLGREDRDDRDSDIGSATWTGAAMDLGREDRDDLAGVPPQIVGRVAAMDLGREDRDDDSRSAIATMYGRPQWISVARTETTATSGSESIGHSRPQWISVARTETTSAAR